MRRLEDPGRQPKRARLASSVVQDNDAPFTDISDSDNGTDDNEEDEEALKISDGLQRLSPASTSDTSEVSELDSTHVKPFGRKSRQKRVRLVDSGHPESSLSRLKAPHRPEPRKVESLGASKEYEDFPSLGLSDPLVRSMNSMSIRRPTPVQVACIPPLLEGEDLTPETARFIVSTLTLYIYI
jgi:hypothetical protein